MRRKELNNVRKVGTEVAIVGVTRDNRLVRLFKEHKPS